MRKLKTKPIIRECRQVRYWKWPHWSYWTTTGGVGTEKGLRAFIGRLSPQEAARLAVRSAEVVERFAEEG